MRTLVTEAMNRYSISPNLECSSDYESSIVDFPSGAYEASVTPTNYPRNDSPNYSHSSHLASFNGILLGFPRPIALNWLIFQIRSDLRRFPTRGETIRTHLIHSLFLILVAYLWTLTSPNHLIRSLNHDIHLILISIRVIAKHRLRLTSRTIRIPTTYPKTRTSCEVYFNSAKRISPGVFRNLTK